MTGMIRSLYDVKVAVIGLGYVGLPLAIEFATQYETFGFDISQSRIDELRDGVDTTLETTKEDFQRAPQLRFTSDLSTLKSCNTYVVTVPTPIDEHNQPDCRPLVAASRMLGEVIAPGDVVIYESTVYPGATEEICIPELEQVSGLRFNKDFFVGYSPERINPGDKERRLPNIVKVTSGSTAEIAEFVDSLYDSIITAGTHRASSIRVAEAAKVIENTQRDLNIALINELSLIFDHLEIDTEEVLKAAGTKWNFLPFRPGLVGGHCIGVDPYYLTHKAQALGYHPEIILAGRRVNDRMGQKIAERIIRLLAKKEINPVRARLLIMGLAFKENCPDIRNTKVVDIAFAMKDYNMVVDVFDPWVDPDVSRMEYGIELITEPRQNTYDAIVLAVAHDEFRELGVEGIKNLGKERHVLFDVKSMLSADGVDGRL